MTHPSTMRRNDEAIANQLEELKRLTGWKWSIQPAPIDEKPARKGTQYPPRRWIIRCEKEGITSSWPHTKAQSRAYLAGIMTGIRVGRMLSEPRINFLCDQADHFVAMLQEVHPVKKPEKLH